MFDPSSVLPLWGLAEASLTAAPGGLNNRSWFVRHAGRGYVLRLYSATSEAVVALEHELLGALARSELSFATPRPVRTTDGASFTSIAIAGSRTFVALFERIEGEPLDDEDILGIEAAGRAFAQLDQVLASLVTGHPSFDGSLARVHPAVADLGDLGEVGEEAASYVRRMEAEVTPLRRSLGPRQLIHDDFAFGNVLAHDGRVTGVLDLEFAVDEPRAAELAIALRLAASKGSRDRIWPGLLRGYLSKIALTDAELAALPALAAHHEAVSLVWWLGRHRRREVDAASLRDHVDRARRLGPWLLGHGDEIVREAMRLRG